VEASGGKLVAEVMGENEVQEGVVIIGCPGARSLKGAIAISASFELTQEPATSVIME
jgi:hypothetical protein